MPWMLGVGVYVVIWWTVLFAVLPFGVRSQQEMNDVVPGSDPGAPVRHRLGLKILVNTGISTAIWLGVDLAYILFYAPP
jgi:predicted secreted protein